MKVLLTGANGFVGSHILAELHTRKIPCSILLRPSSNTRLIQGLLPGLDVRTGSIDDPASLDGALHDATHVIHSAGRTKALRTSEFFETNQAGVRRLVEAANRCQGRIQRLVHVSSLAAGGPAPRSRPATEADPPKPVSPYGESKLEGEREVAKRCQTEWVIVRPPAVYGPGDGEFLRLFQAVKSHLLPRFGGGRQALSLVFVRDLARVLIDCLSHPRAAGKTFYAASTEIVTALELAREIAGGMQTWTVPLPLPTAALWPVCCLQELISRATGKASVLDRAKYAELRAPAWVCDPGRLTRELGLACETGLSAGISETLAWYRLQKWL